MIEWLCEMIPTPRWFCYLSGAVCGALLFGLRRRRRCGCVPGVRPRGPSPAMPTYRLWSGKGWLDRSREYSEDATVSPHDAGA